VLTHLSRSLSEKKGISLSDEMHVRWDVGRNTGHGADMSGAGREGIGLLS
jgi:hypothetical protein